MFIDCQHITFAYNSAHTVLKDVSFTLKKGETLAIVGASGCGKSTLLRVISGILQKLTYHSLEGKVNINSKSPSEYRQLGKLAFMFQEATLMPHLSVLQNIELPLKIKGNNSKHKSKNLLKAIGLEDYSDFLPNSLSGGMKTRVALARSFITEPELLLLDEPFSALDIAWKSNLYVELDRLRTQSNTTIIIVTHDVQEALLLADRIIIMNRLGAIEDNKTVKSEFNLKERVKNISDYMNSVYENYMLPIQDSIIKGQRKLDEE